MPKMKRIAPRRPPKAWFDKMKQEVKEGNPDYSEEQVSATVGDIWYNKMSPSKKRKEVKKEKGSLCVDATCIPAITGRIPAISDRIPAIVDRIVAVKHRIEAQDIGYWSNPDLRIGELFGSAAEKWITQSIENLAKTMSVHDNNTDMVRSHIHDAIEQVKQGVAIAAQNAVADSMTTEALDNMVPAVQPTSMIDSEDKEKVEGPYPEMAEEPPAPQIPMEPGVAPVAPMAASDKAFMPERLRVAFDKTANPAEQSLELVKLDPTFITHLNELEEQADSIESLAGWLKEYIVGRGLLGPDVAEQADWMEPTRRLTSKWHTESSKKVADDDDEYGGWPYSEKQIEWAKPKFISAYIVRRQYGGPEEGGWWYDDLEHLESIPVNNKAEAQAAKAQLEIEYEEGGYEVDIRLEDTAGEYETTSRPHYASHSISPKEKVITTFSQMSPTHEIDAWGMARTTGVEPITAEQVLEELVTQGHAQKEGNWYSRIV